MTAHKACSHPGCTRHAILCYKLNPRDWSDKRATLCTDHARANGYTPVRYERAWSETKAGEHMRGAR